MKVALGSDHAGFLMKEEIKKHLTEQKLECFDFGTFCENPVDYPDIALPVVEAVRSGSADFGILVCGTGVGMAIAANKYRGFGRPSAAILLLPAAPGSITMPTYWPSGPE